MASADCPWRLWWRRRAPGGDDDAAPTLAASGALAASSAAAGACGGAALAARAGGTATHPFVQDRCASGGDSRSRSRAAAVGGSSGSSTRSSSNAGHGGIAAAAAGAADDSDDAWSSADEDDDARRDDPTCLRGGDATPPRTLVQTFSAAALSRPFRASGAAYGTAIVYVAVFAAVAHAYAVPLTLSTFADPDIGLPIFPGAGDTVVTVLPPAVPAVHVAVPAAGCDAIVAAAGALSAHVWAVPPARPSDEQFRTLALLWAVVAHALLREELYGLSFYCTIATGGEVESDDTTDVAGLLLGIVLALGGL